MHYSRIMIVRLLLLLLFGLSTVIPGFSQDVDVDREELESQAGATVEFENFEGPQESVSSADEIRAIGQALSEGLVPEPGATADYFGRYTIFRGVDPADPEGLDADVLSINDDAQVNHIDNVRRIIAGYLVDAFGYSRQDAALIAELTTIYNAVHRGNFAFFSGRYKAIVTDFLDPERAGIATSWTQWAGATQLVIPLSPGREPGDLDAVSPLQLADPAVIEDLRQRRDMGIETRKAMIALIERVIEERTEAIEEEREAIEEERRQIEERRQEIEEEREEIDREAEAEAEQPDEPRAEEAEEPEPEADEPESDGAEEPEVAQTPAEQEAAEPEEDEAAEAQTPEERIADLDEEEEELEEREQELTEREEQLEQEEEEVEELTERAQELYDETSEDQEAVIEEEGRDEAAAAAEPVLFFLVDSSGEAGRLVLVDRRTGELLADQGQPALRRASTRAFGAGVVALEATGGSLTRALLLDEESLELSGSSQSVVYRASSVTVRNESLYMVVQEEGAWKVGRFDDELRLQATSVVRVAPETELTFSEDTLLAQGLDGGVLLLDGDDLRVTR